MIKLEKTPDGICWMRLEDKDNNNAIGDAFCHALADIVSDIKQDKSIKVVIITGLKDIFCSGGSEQFLQQLHQYYQQNLEHEYANYLKSLLNIPVPVIAAMEGSATGGGLTLALYCDIIIGAEQSRYGFSFMNLGFTPGMGTTALAIEAFGSFNGFEMMATGNYPKGKTLKGKSQFNYILPKEQVIDKAIELAQALNDKPRTALELLKKTTSIKKRQLLEHTSTIEAYMHKIAFNEPQMQQWLTDNFTG